MVFDEENKVIIESLNQEQAKAFIKFLESEILRHKVDIQQAEDLIKKVRNMYRL